MTHGGVRVLLNGRTYARPRLNSAVTTSPMCREIWGITTSGKLKSWQHRQHWLRLTGYMASAITIIGSMENCYCSIRWNKCWLRENLICPFASAGQMRTGAGGGMGAKIGRASCRERGCQYV